MTPLLRWMLVVFALLFSCNVVVMKSINNPKYCLSYYKVNENEKPTATKMTCRESDIPSHTLLLCRETIHLPAEAKKDGKDGLGCIKSIRKGGLCICQGEFVLCCCDFDDKKTEGCKDDGDMNATKIFQQNSACWLPGTNGKVIKGYCNDNEHCAARYPKAGTSNPKWIRFCRDDKNKPQQLAHAIRLAENNLGEVFCHRFSDDAIVCVCRNKNLTDPCNGLPNIKKGLDKIIKSTSTKRTLTSPLSTSATPQITTTRTVSMMSIRTTTATPTMTSSPTESTSISARDSKPTPEQSSTKKNESGSAETKVVGGDSSVMIGVAVGVSVLLLVVGVVVGVVVCKCTRLLCFNITDDGLGSTHSRDDFLNGDSATTNDTLTPTLTDLNTPPPTYDPVVIPPPLRIVHDPSEQQSHEDATYEEVDQDVDAYEPVNFTQLTP